PSPPPRSPPSRPPGGSRSRSRTRWPSRREPPTWLPTWLPSAATPSRRTCSAPPAWTARPCTPSPTGPPPTDCMPTAPPTHSRPADDRRVRITPGHLGGHHRAHQRDGLHLPGHGRELRRDGSRVVAVQRGHAAPAPTAMPVHHLRLFHTGDGRFWRQRVGCARG